MTLYLTVRVAALPGGGGFMAEQLHAAEAMRSLFPDVRPRIVGLGVRIKVRVSARVWIRVRFTVE